MSSSTVPCIHGSDYRRCRTCQDLLAHREARSQAASPRCRTMRRPPAPRPQAVRREPVEPVKAETMEVVRALAAESARRAAQAQAQRDAQRVERMQSVCGPEMGLRLAVLRGQL